MGRQELGGGCEADWTSLPQLHSTSSEKRNLEGTKLSAYPRPPARKSPGESSLSEGRAGHTTEARWMMNLDDRRGRNGPRWDPLLTATRQMAGLWQQRSSLLPQTVKNLPVTQETQVRFLGWENPPEKKMASHSSILAWGTSRTEEPSRLQSTGLQRVGYN